MLHCLFAFSTWRTELLGVQVLSTNPFGAKQKNLSEFVIAKSVRSDFDFVLKKEEKKSVLFHKDSVDLTNNRR